MWTVIHIANSRTAAENLKKVLETEGHLVQVKQIGSGAEGDLGNFEILVPASEARDAHEVLTSRIGIR